MLKYALPVCLLAAFAAPAQTLKIPASLDKLASKAKEVVDINLDAKFLSLAARTHEGKKAQGKVGVTNEGKLKGGFVRSYEFENEGEYSQADVDAVAAQLREPGWSCIVNVHSKKKGENTQVCFHSTDGKADGLAVLAAEPKELTIVNLVGTGDLSQLGALGDDFNIPDVALDMKPEK